MNPYKMNPYIVLGVDKNATKSEIKKAYYDLAKVMHPDKGGDEDEFKPIAEAWAVLSDDEQRDEYDRTGVVPNDIEQAILNESLSFIAHMVSDTLKNMVEHKMERQPGDFVEAMKDFTMKQIGENTAAIAQTHVADSLYADTLDKLFLKNPDEFDGADVITGQIRELQEENDFEQFALGNGRKVLEKAIVLLDEFGFKMPLKIQGTATMTIPVQFTGYGFSPATKMRNP